MADPIVDPGRIELAILRADATAAEVHAAVGEAFRARHPVVTVPPVWVARAVAMLRGSETAVGTVAGYPMGLGKATIKAIEATSALKDGAAVVDVTVHLPPLLAGEVEPTRAELIEINRAARAANREAVVRAAVDLARLCRAMPDADAAALACRAAREGGADGIVVGNVEADMIRLLCVHAAGLAVIAPAEPVERAERLLSAGAQRVRMQR